MKLKFHCILKMKIFKLSKLNIRAKIVLLISRC